MILTLFFLTIEQNTGLHQLIYKYIPAQKFYPILVPEYSYALEQIAFFNNDSRFLSVLALLPRQILMNGQKMSLHSTLCSSNIQSAYIHSLQ